MAIDTTSIGTAPRSFGPTTTLPPALNAGDEHDAPDAPRVGRVASAVGRVRYVPALDGLRAVAVLAVLAYHWPASWMPGGFLGVEVFFVISGYLITALLIGERARDGRVQLGAFWKRRARRLLPALFALLASVSVVWLIWHPNEVEGLRGAVVAALAYVTNWYLIAVKQSYFQSVGRPSPLLHLWSLAVEEQFYLVWPLVLLGLLRLFRQRIRPVVVAVLVLAGVSAVVGVMLYHPGADPFRVWYGTDTRAVGLLLGASLAIAVPPWAMRATVRDGARRTVGALGVVAAVVIGWMFIHVNEFDPLVYRGGFVVLDVATVALIVALVHPASTLMGRVLAWRPLVWIGRRSYGIYLWHWPIFVLTRPGLDVTMAGWQLLVLRLGATFGLAELSYRFVEMPVRRGDLSRWLQKRRAAAGADEGTPAETDIELTIHGPVAVPATARRRPTTAAVAALTASALVVGAIGVGLVRAGPAQVTMPGLDLRGVRHDRLGDVIDDGNDTGAPRHVSTTLTTMPPTTVHPPTTPPPTLAPIPPIVPMSGNDVVAIGDSVLLGARGWMRLQFPGVLVNAEVGRQFYVLPGLLPDLAKFGALRDDVVIDLGTNGPPTAQDLDTVLDYLSHAKRIVLVTTREPRSWQGLSNSRLLAARAGHPNVVLADWYGASKDHPDYFVADDVHLTERGGQAYVETIAAALRR